VVQQVKAEQLLADAPHEEAGVQHGHAEVHLPQSEGPGGCQRQQQRDLAVQAEHRHWEEQQVQSDGPGVRELQQQVSLAVEDCRGQQEADEGPQPIKKDGSSRPHFPD
jgi:hypothetical protein